MNNNDYILIQRATSAIVEHLLVKQDVRHYITSGSGVAFIHARVREAVDAALHGEYEDLPLDLSGLAECRCGHIKVVHGEECAGCVARGGTEPEPRHVFMAKESSDEAFSEYEKDRERAYRLFADCHYIGSDESSWRMGYAAGYGQANLHRTSDARKNLERYLERFEAAMSPLSPVERDLARLDAKKDEARRRVEKKL